MKERIPLRITVAWVGGFLLAWMLGWLTHAGFSAFTWNKFTLFDYGVYTNMIWNSGHGRPFVCLVNRTYLATHLSFTLALLGPMFRLWDHPFLLWSLQWGFLAGGTALLMRTAWRLRIPAELILAIAVFYTGYHFTQQTLLSEFHGVSLLLLLVPWLYHCLVFSRRLVWLPWLLILGLREDAAVVMLPLLLYFAIRDRWRAGYVYAALSLAYMLLAMTTLYPLLTGLSLLGRRHADLGDHPLAHFFNTATLRIRLTSLFWVVLPTLPFLGRKRWLPILALPSAALMQAMGGGTARQYALTLHYATPVMTCLTVALVESVARGRETRPPEFRIALRLPLTTAILLLLVTLVSYRLHGFLPLGRRRLPCYQSIHGAGLCTLQAARRIPRDGLLLCADGLAGYCANREQVIDWHHYDPGRHLPDLVFTELKYLDNQRLGFRAWLEEGRFGLVYFDGTHIILKRGADSVANHVVLDAERRRTSGAPFAQSGSRLADIRLTTLHWPGTGARASRVMTAACGVSLDAGDYDAVFLFSARAPEGDAADGWGTLQARLECSEETLAEAAIEPVGGGPRILRTQRLSFSLAAPTRVQAAVVGQRAELWLVRADFVRRRNPWEF